MDADDGTPQVRSPRPRPVSIRDVARAAGVSHQTVSRVINEHPRVAPTTRELVLTSIRELGFRPNLAARALASGQISSVVVLTSNTTLYGYAATLKGIEEEARAGGLAVGVCVLESAAEADLAATVDRAVQPGVAVIVIAYDLAGDRVMRALPAGVPAAAAVESHGGLPSQPGRAWLDDREGARLAVRHLLDLGHQTVHYLELPSSTKSSQRTAGWREELLAAGVQPPPPVTAGWDCVSGYRAGRVLARDDDVTAVLCGNDDLAIGVLRAMQEAGRPVPASVSVVGFDDMPQSAYLTPALTTMRLDFVGLGRDCVRLLQGLLDPGLPGVPAVARRCELIVRESSGPPGTAPGVVRRRQPPP